MHQHQKVCCILRKPLLQPWRGCLIPFLGADPRARHVNGHSNVSRSRHICSYSPVHQSSDHVDTPDMLEQDQYQPEPVVPPPFRVLLTNDDGGDSPFFVPWAAYVQEKLGWKCMICPPARGQSFVSKSISMKSVEVEKFEDNRYHIDGSPATCVNIGLYHLAPDCDFVISGPNVGHNVGRGSVLSSGTVGAALEGCISGRRSLAISFPFFGGWNNWTDEDLSHALQAAGNVVKQLWDTWPDYEDVLYNINVPLDYRDVDGNPNRQPKGVSKGCSEAQTNPSSSWGHPVLHSTTNKECGPLIVLVDDPLIDKRKVATATHLQKPRDGEPGIYDWGPKGLRVFQAPANDPEGDVAAIKEGNISVCPLRAGYLPHT